MTARPCFVPLADVLAQVRTGPFGSVLHKHEYIRGGVPLVNPMHINGGQVTPTAEMAVSEGKACELADFALSAGDVVIARRGEMGRCAVVQSSQSGWLIGTGSMALTPSEHVLPEYLQRFLSSPESIAALEANAVGSTMANLNQGVLLNLQIPFVSLSTQRNAVAKLDALTARTARARIDLDRVPVLAEHYSRAVLAAAFSSIPEATEDVAVEQVALHIFDGPFGSHLKSADYTDAGPRVIRLENIGHLKFNEDKRTFISEDKYTSLARHTLKADDVLFSSFVDEEVRVCLLPLLEGVAINKADCFCVRVDTSKCDPRFLAYRLACHSTYETFSAQVHGATRPRVNLGQLRAFRFTLPSISMQAEIVRRIDVAFAEIDRLVAEAAAARRLLDRLDQAILAKAFRGELVPQDPNDEPAGVLLDRIRAERAATPAKPARGRRAKAAA